MLSTNKQFSVHVDADGVKRIACGEKRSEAFVFGNVIETSTLSTPSLPEEGATSTKKIEEHLRQTDAILDDIDAMCRAVGGSLESIKKIHVAVHHRHHLGAVRERIGQRFSAGRKPAVTHAINEVGDYGQIVEINATGLLDPGATMGDLALTNASIDSLSLLDEEKLVLKIVLGAWHRRHPDEDCTIRLFALHMAARVNDPLEGGQRTVFDGIARQCGIPVYN